MFVSVCLPNFLSNFSQVNNFSTCIWLNYDPKGDSLNFCLQNEILLTCIAYMGDNKLAINYQSSYKNIFYMNS